ncbi:unnamed protein product [Symbiodinium natans]|uniref:Uncharacterized protein n=1 Tax=Symbiodinium natans TaxID=878477 RepID=A0A812IHM2_9DINO|nr:unnamed protein product [Symbiodinium natans]
MAWTSRDFCSELEECQKLLQYPSAQKLAEGLVKALFAKVDSSSDWMPSDFVVCLEAVEAGTLADNWKEHLRENLLSKASNSKDSQKGSKLVKNPQTVTCIHAYMTKSELEILMKSHERACDVIVSRLRTMGVTSMAENTKRWAVALWVQSMLWCGQPAPQPDEQYCMVQKLLKAFQASTTPAKAVAVRNYPASPEDMGQSWIRAVYDKEEPCKVSLPGVENLALSVPVRSTSSVLSWNHAGCSFSSRKGSGKGKENPMDMLRQIMNWAQAETAANPLTNLRILEKKPPSALETLQLVKDQLAGQQQQPAASTESGRCLALPALEDKPGKAAEPAVVPAEATAAENAEQAGQTRKKDLADYEKAALQQLLDRQKKKKKVDKKEKQADTEQQPKQKAADKCLSKPQGNKPVAKAGQSKDTKGVLVAKNKVAKPAKGEKHIPPVLKKPACKRAQTQDDSEELYEGTPGCSKCRGSGCPQCRLKSFKGQRLPGREAWQARMEQKKRRRS